MGNPPGKPRWINRKLGPFITDFELKGNGHCRHAQQPQTTRHHGAASTRSVSQNVSSPL